MPVAKNQIDELYEALAPFVCRDGDLDNFMQFLSSLSNTDAYRRGTTITQAVDLLRCKAIAVAATQSVSALQPLIEKAGFVLEHRRGNTYHFAGKDGSTLWARTDSVWEYCLPGGNTLNGELNRLSLRKMLSQRIKSQEASYNLPNANASVDDLLG